MRADPQPRFLGLDEGPFSFDDETVPVVGVMTRGALQVEAVGVAEVAVDGWDAARVVEDLVGRLPGAGPDVILIDGITLGGLNLVDVDALAQATGRPVLGVTRRAPDRAAMERAVAQAPEPERRRSLLPTMPPLTVTIAAHRLHVQVAASPGHTLPEPALVRLLRSSMASGGLPEALRLAHHVATALVRGVSGTRA